MSGCAAIRTVTARLSTTRASNSGCAAESARLLDKKAASRHYEVVKHPALTLLLLLAACGEVPIEDDTGTGTNTLRVEADYLGWRQAWISVVYIDGEDANVRGQAPVDDATLTLCGQQERSVGCTESIKQTPDRRDTPGEYIFRMESWTSVPTALGGGTMGTIAPMGMRYTIESARGAFEASIRGLNRLDLVGPVTTGETHTVSAGAEVAVSWTEREQDEGAAPATMSLSTWSEGQDSETPVTFTQLDPGARSGTITAPAEPGTYTLVVEAGRSLEPAGGLAGSILRAWRRDEATLVVTP